ncbi:MAG: terminase, partial [Lachnospiraceae bacterium]|nr:terminase [Lachnospiraceae bacterium]
MEWQTLILDNLMGQNEEGLWVHSRFGFSVPRRNGKNEVVAMRELWGLKQGEAILHTAHRTSTSGAAYKRLVRLLEASGIKEIRGKVKDGYKAGKSKGQEFIELSEKYGGGRVDFRTRTTTGGLGEGFDLLVIDEAQEYTDDQESTLKYTVSDSKNPQIIMCGTPPTAVSSGTVFSRFRTDCLAGELLDAGWEEWSVDQLSDQENVDLW